MGEQSHTMTGRSYMDDMLNMDDDLEYLESEFSEIAEFYKGLNILVTGGSGFLGRLLIEKLLRSCPKIGKIYMLIRAKKGKTPQQRFEEHFDDIIYERLKKEQPNFLKHVVLVEGDTSLSDLGLSTKNREILIDNINIVFHSAATVRFDESIRQAVNINVRGTKLLLLLAREMKNLRGFIHISTAFSNCIHDYIEEKFYEPPMNPDKILSMLELLDDDALDVLKNKLMGKWPNTYAFSKALGEEVVRKHSTGIPSCVVRPSIMLATDKEPIRGWINNYYGPTGVAIGAGMGLLRSLHCNSMNVADIIPADYVINNIIVAGWDIIKKWEEDQAKRPINPPIFNVVSSVENPVTWGEFMSCNEKHSKDIPTVVALWHYIFFLNKRLWLHNIVVFLLHTTPAAIVDVLALLTGREPMLTKAYRKINKFSSVISYFSTNKWEFNNDNVLDLWNKVSIADKETFNFSLKSLDWNDYFFHHVRGLRLYILKDPLSTIPAGRVKQKWLRYSQYTINTVFCLLLGWAVFSLLRLLVSSWS